MIPKQWTDQTLAGVEYLRSLTSLAGVTISRTKQDGKTKQVVLDTEYQQLETPISRRCTLLLEAWCTKPNGGADVAESFRLMSLVLYELQNAPNLLTHVVNADTPIGPRVVKDLAKFEYHEGSLVWVVSR